MKVPKGGRVGADGRWADGLNFDAGQGWAFWPIQSVRIMQKIDGAKNAFASERSSSDGLQRLLRIARA